MRSLISVIAALAVLSGCHAKANAPGEAPTGVVATPGDGLAVVNWDVLPDLDYWIFFQAGSTVDVESSSSTVIRRAVAPRIISGLTNGTQYAFAMNATHNDSSAGPSSPPTFATPTLAGVNWSAGTPLPPGAATPANLRGLMIIGSRFVTVGDATTTGAVTSPTILAGDFNYTVGQFNFTTGDPQGVTAWTPPASLPVGFAADLTSVTFAGSTFVALAGNGSVISSGDGLNWVANSTVPATGMNGVAFAFTNGGTTPTYVAVGNGGNIFKANDISTGTWTSAASGTTSDLTGIFLISPAFFVTGSGGTLLTSSDAITWNPPLATNTTSTLRGIAFCGSCTGVQYVAVGDSGTLVTGTFIPGTTTIVWNVVDPSTFTPPLAAPLPNLLSVTVGGAAGTRFLAVGQGGAVVYSDDGVNWSTTSSGSSDLAQVRFFGGLYLSVGNAGANVVSR